jgi:hypothetical protein
MSSKTFCELIGCAYSKDSYLDNNSYGSFLCAAKKEVGNRLDIAMPCGYISVRGEIRDGPWLKDFNRSELQVLAALVLARKLAENDK